MPKPTTLPTWATDANFSSGPRSGQPTKVDPAAAAAQGFVPGGTFLSNYANYVLNNISNSWIAWLNNTVANEIDDHGSDDFGDGSDGNVTIAVNTTLTRDMYYNNLTINNGITLFPDGYRIFVAGTLTISGGLISGNGANGSNGTGAAGGAGGAARGLPRSLQNNGAGAAGGAPAAVGTNGTAVTNGGHLFGSGLGGGGNGGDGAGGGAAIGGTGAALTGTAAVRSTGRLGWIVNSTGQILLRGGAGGGGGGGATGAGGGGGGAGGDIVCVAAKTYAEPTGFTDGISARGGNGGNGFAGANNGGGGGGGGGGVILLTYRRALGNALNFLQAVGGTGGLGPGAALDGVAGQNGQVWIFKR